MLNFTFFFKYLNARKQKNSEKNLPSFLCKANIIYSFFKVHKCILRRLKRNLYHVASNDIFIADFSLFKLSKSKKKKSYTYATKPNYINIM